MCPSLQDRIRKRREEEDDDMMLFIFPALYLMSSTRGGESPTLVLDNWWNLVLTFMLSVWIR
jgi:hypothetical protein